MLYTNFHIDPLTCYKSMLGTNADMRYSHRNNHNFPIEFINQINLLKPKTTFDSHFNYFDFISSNPQLEDALPTVATLDSCLNPTQKFLEFLKKDLPSPVTIDSFSNIYPIAVRYTDGKKVWLIERPPFKAQITYKASPASSNAEHTPLEMWMPWTVMLLIAEPEQSHYVSYLYFNDSPITSFDDLAVPCFHMNMYQDARMCLSVSYSLLQHHLSETNSYTISNIYNFILNDYMSGGWNADLGLHVFESLSRYSKTAQSLSLSIKNGDNDLKLKSARTATGRISWKKYYKNYFQYFSNLELNEILSLITSIKKDTSEHTHHHLSTYSQVIKSFTSTSESSVDKLINFDFNLFPYIRTEKRLFIHSKFNSLFDSDNPDSANFIKELNLVLFKYFLEENKQEIYTMLSNEDYITNSSSHSINIFVDSDFNVHLIDENFDYSTLINLESLTYV